MTEEVCEGCGVPLQSDDPGAPGYVPGHVARRGERTMCRRCFRIAHYGKEEEGLRVDEERAWSIVQDVASRADACVFVVDVLDFEGSFLPSIAKAVKGRLLLAVNKIDLLPSRTPAEEVAEWAGKRLSSHGIACDGVFPISARKGYGVRVLFDAARRAAGKSGSVALLGATNVGKSTLVGRWLGAEQKGPTVSRFPGTTQGVIERELPGAGVELVDTPGLVPRGRIGDNLCTECASRFVPDEQIASKLVRLSRDRSLLFGGLAGITPLHLAGDDPIALAFAAPVAPIEHLATERLRPWMQGERLPSAPHLCAHCAKQLEKAGWEQVVLEVGEMEDLAIHGLGWLSPRRAGFKAQVTVPAGTTVSVRPRLIGPKTPLEATRRT